MRIFSLSLIAALFIGCGGSSDSKSDTSTPDTTNITTNNITTITEAKQSIQSIVKLQSIDFSRFIATLQGSSQKTTINQTCPGGGSSTYEVSDNQKEIKLNYDSCVSNNNETLNGSLSMTQGDSILTYNISFNDFTYQGIYGEGYIDMEMKASYSNNIYTSEMNGEIRQTINGNVESMSASNLIIQEKDTDLESWYTVNGNLAFVSSCYTGSYELKTVENLVDATDGSDNTESGVLEINGATYSFDNPYVTIKAGSEEETILQSELEQDLNTTGCNLS
jgi:hypothetical protein